MSNCHLRVDLTETDVLAVDGGLSQVRYYEHILRGDKRQEHRCGQSVARPRHVAEVLDELPR
jgi:hypothetical protein